jgi:hypothetical protein
MKNISISIVLAIILVSALSLTTISAYNFGETTTANLTVTTIIYNGSSAQWNDNYTNFSIGWNYALNGSLNWNNNYSAFLDLPTWAKVMNGTVLTSETFWNANYTNFSLAYEYALNGSNNWNNNYSNFSAIYGYALNASNTNVANLSYVPYTGANGNVNLGNYNVSSWAGIFNEIRTVGTDNLSIYEDRINSSSGIVWFEDGVTQLYAPTAQGYFNTIMSNGPIESDTAGGQFNLGTWDGFDIALINGSYV